MGLRSRATPPPAYDCKSKRRCPVYREEVLLRLDFLADDLRAADFLAVDFRAEDFRAVDFLAVDFLAVDRDFPELVPAFFRLADFLRDGTLPPARRASESPMAIACLRLVTFLPDLPLFRVPRLRSCMAFRTLL
jgi:hypothetical protein